MYNFKAMNTEFLTHLLTNVFLQISSTVSDSHVRMVVVVSRTTLAGIVSVYLGTGGKTAP